MKLKVMAKLLRLRGGRLYSKLLYISIICLAALIMFYIFEAIFRVLAPSPKFCSDNDTIDVVYTWVNGSDPIFLKELKFFLKTRNISVDDKYLSQRFIDKNELQFSLRSLEKFAPWINHVYIVTNGQIPYWLNLDYPKLTIITHKEIFLNRDDLPTFSSPAIESHLHRIPGISKRFLYFNDDVFLGQPIFKEDFISQNEGYKLYFSYSLGMCSPQCFWAYVADDQCDEACNNFYCQYDGGDCENSYTSSKQILVDKINSVVEKTKIENDIINDHKMVSKFKLSKKFNETNKNYSTVVEEYNNNIIENDKIKNKRYRRKQRKLRTMKSLRNNSKNVSFFNRTSFAYGDSLQHSNRLFNLKYGFLPRFVPSHTPVMVDRNVIEDLQKKFFKEVMVTSKNRFRNHDDLQFTFAYYYFIYHERNQFSAEQVFQMFDTDMSGTWSDREIRTLLTRVYQLPLSYAIVEHFESMLLNCSETKKFTQVQTPKYERYLDSRLPVITQELILNCPELVKMIESTFGNKRKYKYKIVRNSEGQYIHFKQLNSNLTDVVGQLDEIRGDPRKFVCLNDNLDYTKTSENEVINSLLYDFYLSFFPFRSKYELPKEYRNKFLHMNDLDEWKNHHLRIKCIVFLALLFVIYMIGFRTCIKNICGVLNRFF